MTEGQNPWVSRPADLPEETITPEQAIAAPTGPTTPQDGVPEPDAPDQLPVVGQSIPADLFWVGTHGGSGESTLSALVPEWRAADHGWPLLEGGASTTAKVVLTARTNVRGLRAAQAAAIQWGSGSVPYVDVLGLVLIADAPGRLPKPLRDLSKVVSGGVPRCWSLPWIESWRVGDPISLSDSPRPVRRLVDQLTTILQTGAAAPRQPEETPEEIGAPAPPEERNSRVRS